MRFWSPHYDRKGYSETEEDWFKYTWADGNCILVTDDSVNSIGEDTPRIRLGSSAIFSYGQRRAKNGYHATGRRVEMFWVSNPPNDIKDFSTLEAAMKYLQTLFEV